MKMVMKYLLDKLGLYNLLVLITPTMATVISVAVLTFMITVDLLPNANNISNDWASVEYITNHLLSFFLVGLITIATLEVAMAIDIKFLYRKFVVMKFALIPIFFLSMVFHTFVIMSDVSNLKMASFIVAILLIDIVLITIRKGIYGNAR